MLAIDEIVAVEKIGVVVLIEQNVYGAIVVATNV